ncbi:tetratricopeptide repeat protein 39B-like [Lineus longissimus]|uniref:tetratricopeptide repeat protein 39B-like n=1 Tax=Lineus longissimus TaxID=88925 RepID=UPI00315D0FE7
MSDDDSDLASNFGDQNDRASEMDLGAAIEETTMALNLFLNNKFSEAKAIMEPCFREFESSAHHMSSSEEVSTPPKNKIEKKRLKHMATSSMYHALGYGTIMYLQAVMTFDSGDIDAAIQTCKRSVIVCNKRRKKTSMMDSFSKAVNKPNYNAYTDEEIHAELCYAECLLERALLTFLQDENLISFVKGGLKIRQCYHSYKECYKIMKHRTWRDMKMKAHFESGCRMGVGAFNLMISLLPTKVMKLLEFVGFSGNKYIERCHQYWKYGLAELEAAADLQHSLRGPLCSMILISYHTVVTYVLGTADGDIDFAEKTLKLCLQKYPKGAMFLFFAGRLEEIKGNMDEAIHRYDESIESQSEWRQFHHLCFWELMWCHAFKCDWLVAMKYAEKLFHESRWSRATYTYQKASFLMMCDNKENTEETQEHLNYLFSRIPVLKQKIAGKSLPIEKFAVKKAQRFVKQGNRLTLPALELIYVWNGFSIIGKKMHLLEPMMASIEKTIQEVLQNKDSYEFFEDDYCLCLILKGVCLRHLGRSFQAEMCFREIADNEKKLKQDPYLSPYAQAELAFMMLDDEQYDNAKKLLDHVKTGYKGYSLESRLHFRIHSAHLKIKALKKGEGNTADFNGMETTSQPGTPVEEARSLPSSMPTTPTAQTPDSPGIS